MYIGPNNKAMVTLYNYLCLENSGKRKNHMEKILPQERTRNNMKNMYSLCLFLHLNELTELLLEQFNEEVVNSQIMH